VSTVTGDELAGRLRALADHLDPDAEHAAGEQLDIATPVDLRSAASILERMASRGQPEAAEANAAPSE